MFPILKFTTFFKPVLWGGTKIADFKAIPSQGDNIGESWEISPIPEHESIIDGGEFSGLSLSQILSSHGKPIMGEPLFNRYGDKFPLLIKFIDSSQDLSIQVHPDDDLAAQRHDGTGKTEMWYSLSPTPSAFIYAGFSHPMTPQSFLKAVNDGEITGHLKKFHISQGDMIMLPPGCVHALGQGNFVLEVQQASDVTYRIFDYNRPDASGKPRKLHIEESVDAIDYDLPTRTARNIPAQTNKETLLERCPYFTSSIIKVDKHFVMDLERRRSFTIAVAIKGDMTLTAPDGSVHPLPQGQTLLIPAIMPKVAVDGDGELVTVFIE